MAKAPWCRRAGVGRQASSLIRSPALRAWKRGWAETRSEIDECIGNGDNVVVFGRLHARGATSGASVEANVSQVVVVRGGKVLSSKLFQSRLEALEAAGLRE